MMGFEPIPRFSRVRILSPLRLPFRHIGAALNIVTCYSTGENEFPMSRVFKSPLVRILIGTYLQPQAIRGCVERQIAQREANSPL